MRTAGGALLPSTIPTSGSRAGRVKEREPSSATLPTPGSPSQKLRAQVFAGVVDLDLSQLRIAHRNWQQEAVPGDVAPRGGPGAERSARSFLKRD